MTVCDFAAGSRRRMDMGCDKDFDFATIATAYARRLKQHPLHM